MCKCKWPRRKTTVPKPSISFTVVGRPQDEKDCAGDFHSDFHFPVGLFPIFSPEPIFKRAGESSYSQGGGNASKSK